MGRGFRCGLAGSFWFGFSQEPKIQDHPLLDLNHRVPLDVKVILWLVILWLFPPVALSGNLPNLPSVWLSL